MHICADEVAAFFATLSVVWGGGGLLQQIKAVWIDLMRQRKANR
ncbi:hypothetical protein [Caudoviricetes sp.]|nr:hypothetical protein [Caudoviricetes sp.]UOF81876.1 hypothetical protein [Caudoviricetes sp.]